jgi:hypothetical protein
MNPFARLAAWLTPARNKGPGPLPAHYLAHSPSCLAEFTRAAAPADLAALAAPGPRSTAFGLGCPCGSGTGELHGRGGLPGALTGPLGFRCLACEAGRVLFDPALHGAAGERFRADAPAGGVPASAACRACEWNEFALAVGFDYDPPEFDDPAREEFHGRPEDFFVACRVVGRCAQCGTRAVLATADCLPAGRNR